MIEKPGDDETRVRLEGPLDLSTASLAEHELLRRSRGGTAALTVDAAPGTPAEIVLSLVTLIDRQSYPQAES